MSKLEKFLQIVQLVLPVVLVTAAPGLAPLAPVIIHAIGASEGMKGATGAQKLNNALQLVGDAVDISNTVAANQGRGPVMDKAQVLTVATGAINTTIGFTNILHNLGTSVTLPPAPPA